MNLSEKDKAYLKNYDDSQYEKISHTVDTALFRYVWERGTPAKIEILLVERKNSPYADTWALPGGFCEIDEDLKAAAKRELLEETGLKGRYYGQLHSYSAVDRDPRTRVIGTSYLAVVGKGENSEPKADDDAKNAKWFEVTMHRMPVDGKNYRIKLSLKHESLMLGADIHVKKNSQGEWERELIHSEKLAFDHGIMIAMASEALRQKAWQSDLAFCFLDKAFELADLQRIFETISRKELLRTTFFSHIKPLIQLVDSDKDSILEQRYQFNEDFHYEDSSSMLELWQ
jgi:hydrolase, NUDIX family